MRNGACRNMIRARSTRSSCWTGFRRGFPGSPSCRKRENFRKAFDDFDPEKIARYGKRDVKRLLKNEGIIRAGAKIEAAIKGAQLWLDIEEKEPGGFTRIDLEACGRQAEGQSLQDDQAGPAKTQDERRAWRRS